MGINVDNWDGGPHVQEARIIGYFLHLHRGDEGIETRSQDCTRAQWLALHGAVLLSDMAQMDKIGEEIWGPWWVRFVRNRPGGLESVRILLS